MKVKELVEKLKEYNQEAKVNVIVDCMPSEFEIWYGSREGCTKENCDCVDISVDLNQHEIINEQNEKM